MRAHSKDVILAEPQLHVLLPHQAAVALVVGYDQRAGAEHSNVSRSDTVMLLRADPATHSASLLSFPRDLGVPIYCPNKNGKGTHLLEPLDRINAAYAYCKAAGTLATVEKATGLRINYLVTVNFHGFKEIVDKLGGIWLDIDRRYYNRNVGSAATDYANINLQPGYQLLDGERALEFVRFRHTDDDYHRVARQQEFVRALKQQFSHNFRPLKFPSLVSTIVHNVEVGGTLSDKDVLNYAWFAVTMPGGHIFQVQIQGITGTGQTTAPPGAIRQAVERFTHPNVAQSKDANAAALRAKAQPAKAKARPEGERPPGAENEAAAAVRAAEGGRGSDRRPAAARAAREARAVRAADAHRSRRSVRAGSGGGRRGSTGSTGAGTTRRSGWSSGC